MADTVWQRALPQFTTPEELACQTGWSEPKATGIARVFQRMREPATKDDWAILCVGVAGIAILAAALL